MDRDISKSAHTFESQKLETKVVSIDGSCTED